MKKLMDVLPLLLVVVLLFATISVSAVAIAPFRAEILPPPGTGALPGCV